LSSLVICWQVRVIVSGVGDWRYVDCVSIKGGKFEALEYVRTLFGVPQERCVAAGDSGNDVLMLEGTFIFIALHCSLSTTFRPPSPPPPPM